MIGPCLHGWRVNVNYAQLSLQTTIISSPLLTPPLPFCRPAWTEEGLIAPWHRHLAAKQGWMYFIVQEGQPHPYAVAAANSSGSSSSSSSSRDHAAASSAGGGKSAAAPAGRVMDFAPEADPLLGPRAALLVTGSPQAALRYAARLAQLAAAAGRPLSSVRALSCFSLNGGPYRALYDCTANLLHYVPQAASAGTAAAAAAATAAAAPAAATPAAAAAADGGGGPGRSAPPPPPERRPWPAVLAGSAVSRWVHDYDTAPRCDPYAGPLDRPGLVRRARAELSELQAAAGLWVEAAGDARGGGLRRAVCWDGGARDGGDDRGGAPCPFLAYMWT
jgi:hypothetical protein